MFSNNFVVAVKVNGKILREIQDVAYLPFGTEYSILLKNVSAQKARVKVSIDGKEATEDVRLIVDAFDTFELKRFIKNGNLKTGNSFKFIEKTAQISQYRGDRVEDGLITIMFEFERKPAPKQVYRSPWENGILGSPDCYRSAVASNTTTTAYYNSSNSSETFDNFAVSAPMSAAPTMDWMEQDLGRVTLTSTLPLADDGKEQKMRGLAPNTAGVTAPGKIVEQEFHFANGFNGDDVIHTMTLQLKGTDNKETPIVTPVVVKRVQRCTMCGATAKQTAKFCHMCGASVEIV